jgi:uncharacterized protein with FMN-binding domain
MAALALSVTTTAGLAATLGLTGGSSAATLPSAQGGIVETGSALGSSASASSTGLATSTVVNGDVFTNRFGPVQVQAVLAADGSLSRVDAVQFPAGDRRSRRINDRAVPVLNSEALTAQSARVDTISGATYTSRGYAQSLQSAIDEARVAGLTDLA